MIRFFFVGLVALCASRAASSQPRPLASGDRSTERSAGFSWYSPVASGLGSIGHRRVYLTGIRREWVYKAAGPLAFAYVIEMVPMAAVERTVGNIEKCKRNANWVTFTCEYDTSARVAFGAGGSPFGFKLYFKRGGLTRFYGTAGAGGLVFTSDVPVDGSRRANFTFDYGLGLELPPWSGQAVTIGYKFHHISNGGTKPLNPGLDANVFYVGLISRLRRQQMADQGGR